MKKLLLMGLKHIIQFLKIVKYIMKILKNFLRGLLKEMNIVQYN